MPGSDGYYTLTLVEMSLKTNPEVANCEYKDIVCNICRGIHGDPFRIMIPLFCETKKGLLQKFSVSGWLPIHIVAQRRPLEDLKYLLEMCPEAGLMVDSSEDSILCCVLYDINNSTAAIQ